MAALKTERWQEFNESERSTITLGLTMICMDIVSGFASGEPWEEPAAVNTLVICKDLVSQIGRSLGDDGIDAALGAELDQLKAHVNDEYGVSE